MKTIYKYELEVTDFQTVALPKEAELLTVQYQSGTPVLWAMVDTNKPLEERHLEVFGTGQPIPVDMGVSRKYIATFQIARINFVGHVFERIN